MSELLKELATRIEEQSDDIAVLTVQRNKARAALREAMEAMKPLRACFDFDRATILETQWTPIRTEDAIRLMDTYDSLLSRATELGVEV